MKAEAVRQSRPLLCPARVRLWWHVLSCYWTAPTAGYTICWQQVQTTADESMSCREVISKPLTHQGPPVVQICLVLTCQMSITKYFLKTDQVTYFDNNAICITVLCQRPCYNAKDHEISRFIFFPAHLEKQEDLSFKVFNVILLRRIKILQRGQIAFFMLWNKGAWGNESLIQAFPKVEDRYKIICSVKNMLD